MKTKWLIPLVLLLSAISTNAYAKGPRGFFARAGFTLGAGSSSGTISSGSTSQTTSQDWKLDGGLNLGGGVAFTRMFSLTVGGYWTGQYRKINNSSSAFANNFDILAGTDIYLPADFVVGAQVGFAYLRASTNTEVAGSTVSSVTTEPGWGLRVSAGWEASYQTTIGVRFYYMNNFYYPSDNYSLSYGSFGGSVYIRI